MLVSVLVLVHENITGPMWHLDVPVDDVAHVARNIRLQRWTYRTYDIASFVLTQLLRAFFVK
jgi:hypothetical protein